MAGTEYAKWDRFVAELSSDEEDERVSADPLPAPKLELDPGEGAGLGWDGRTTAGIARPSNAKGNALGTNKERKSLVPIQDYAWEDRGGDSVHLTVPLRPLGKISTERVSVRFSERSCEVLVGGNVPGQQHQLLFKGLPGLMPEKSSFRVGSVSSEGGGAGRGEGPCVHVVLRKLDPAVPWPAGGELVVREAPRRTATIRNYAFTDGSPVARVALRVPGVHELPPGDIAVRFRELSLDVTCRSLRGADHIFAVTELPMEIEVSKCRWSIGRDELVLHLHKWAKTTWFKLQVSR